MRTVQSSIELEMYKRAFVAALQDGEGLVFLDTNVVAWGFRLNDAAYREFTRWLSRLVQDSRLAIPAWTVHEYNHHLLQNDQAFFLPHKSLGKLLQSNLAEFAKVAHLMISETSATELGHTNRDTLLNDLDEAMNTVRRCVAYLAKSDASRRNVRAADMEHFIAQAGLMSPVQELADAVVREADGRYVNRLSPGYKDGEKRENAWGDLIIWKEILATCSSRHAKSAVLITNDRKADWVYTPLTVVLPNNKSVDGTSEAARIVKLPKPDLMAEFEKFTGSDKLYILSIDAAIDALSSDRLNPRDAQDFRHMALAVRVDLARSPTEAVKQWFLKNPDARTAAIKGVCNWGYSPSEVDMQAFADWTIERMKMNATEAEEVDWGSVFCEFFL